MSFVQKDMTGALFINDKRESDHHPNARGSAMIDGVEYFVDAWTNKTKDGAKYQKLAFKRKDKPLGPGMRQAAALRTAEPVYDDEPPPF